MNLAFNSWPLISSDFTLGVKKINDNLYIGQKEAGVYLVMERIDDAVADGQARQEFWQNYINQEYKSYDIYKRNWLHGSIPQDKGYFQFTTNDNSSIERINSLKLALTQHHSNNELWICFICTKNIQNVQEVTINDIERVVPIMTTTEAPMTVHGPLSRSFNYMLQAIETTNNMSLLSEVGEAKSKEIGLVIPDEGTFKLHLDLGMELHSFGAKVIRIRDENKIYMIAFPLSITMEIMCKALPKNVYIGDNITSATALYEGSKQAFEARVMQQTLDALTKEINDLNDKIHAPYHRDIANWLEKRNSLELEVKAKMAERSDLQQAYTRQKERDIQEIANTLKMDLTDSPIKKIGKRIQIFDQDRKQVIFDFDQERNIIKIKDQVITD